VAEARLLLREVPQSPLRIAVLGKRQAGKSSLINLLLSASKEEQKEKGGEQSALQRIRHKCQLHAETNSYRDRQEAPPPSHFCSLFFLSALVYLCVSHLPGS
jgi:septin family protein